MRDALDRQFDIVLAESLDRFSRDQEDTAGLFKRLTFLGVRIVTLAEGEISHLHVGFKGTMNAIYLKDLADKTRRGLRGRVEAGKSGGGLCFGYRVGRAREYMAGNAALTAVQSALAAQRGFSANPDLLEAKGGWLDTFGNNTVDLDAIARPLRAPWDIERFLAIKLMPGAHALHSSLEAAIQASTQAHVAVGEIARIIHSGPPKTSITYDPKVPTDMVEAIH